MKKQTIVSCVTCYFIIMNIILKNKTGMSVWKLATWQAKLLHYNDATIMETSIKQSWSLIYNKSHTGQIHLAS